MAGKTLRTENIRHPVQQRFRLFSDIGKTFNPT